MKATLVLVVMSLMTDMDPGSHSERLARYAEKPYDSMEECMKALPKVAAAAHQYYSTDESVILYGAGPMNHYGLSLPNFSIQLDCYQGGPKIEKMDLDQFLPKEQKETEPSGPFRFPAARE
jgi:hypothetical protein